MDSSPLGRVFAGQGVFTSLLSSIVVVGLSAIVVDYIRILLWRRTLPPGPLPWPIVGNTFQLPDNKSWVWFDELAKQYDTPIVTVWAGRRPQLYIADAWTADELLNKRAAIYSDRPRMVVFGELGQGERNLVSMSYGQRWRDLRKITHQGLGIQQVRSYREFQDNESRVVPYDILREPERFASHFERYATSTVTIIGFGRRLQSYDDPMITEVIYIMQLSALFGVPGKTFPMLMESLPWLSRIPFAPWLRHNANRNRGTAFFHAVAAEADAQSPHDSYSRDLIREHAKNFNLSKAELANLAGNLLGGGADTSSSTLICFVLACIAFPEVLPRAWEELDRVVGHERSPTLDDQEELPYISAFTSEVFRWRQVAVMGGQPHAPTEDDEYNGWKIPKGTWIQANLWSIHRHPREFPDPDRFNPERFLKENRLPYPDRRGYSTFGYGRRICAGMALAEQGTWVTIARLLWAFNIKNAVDKSGKPLPIDIFSFTNGSNYRPNPFKAQFIPRSETIRKTIEREGEQALADLAKYNLPSKMRLSGEIPPIE